MEQYEKLRYQTSKERKLSDDATNLQTFYSSKLTEKQKQLEDHKVGQLNQESFFERLRREDNEREAQKR